MRWLNTWLMVLTLVAVACSSTADRPEASADGPGPGIVATPGTAGTVIPTADAEVRAAPGVGGPGITRPGVNAPQRGARPTVEEGDLPVGVTETAIKIGIWFLDSSDACAALGIQPGSTGQCGSEQQDENQAVIDWVNENGGLGGRTLEPVFFRTSTGRSSYAAQAEAACAHFTEDEKVFMAVSEGQVGRPFMAHCLAQHGVPFVEPGFYPFDAPEYRELAPYIVQPNRARPERWVRAYIRGLQAQGFFSGDTRIGLVRFDAAPYDRVTAGVLKPELSRSGHRLAAEAMITLPPSVSTYGDMNAQISNAILEFKANDVNRVIFFTDLGELQTFWFHQAESQDFRPRYGFSSIDWPGRFATFAPEAQMRGAVGVGFLPAFDVVPEQDPGGPGALKCKKILRDAGLEPGSGRSNRCDSLFFLQALLDRATSLTPDGLRATVEGLGTSFVAAASFSTRFSPGRYDGPDSYRFLFFDEDCTCFKYRGRLRPLG